MAQLTSWGRYSHCILKKNLIYWKKWYRVGNALFCSSLFHSSLFCSSLFCSSLFRSSLFALSFFTLSLKIALLKERPWANRSCGSLKRATVSELLFQKSDETELIFNQEWHVWFARCFRANRIFTFSLSKNERFAQKIRCFHHVLDSFHRFSPLLQRT